VLESDRYTLPSKLPPLEIHHPGQNSSSLIPDHKRYFLMLVAGCRECMGPAIQENSMGQVNAAQGDSAATRHIPEDNLAHTESTSPSTHSKGKKRRHASSGAAQGNLSYPHGRKAARMLHRAKGKLAQAAGSRGDEPISSEETSNKSSQEGIDWGAEPCRFTGIHDQRFADCIHRSLKAQAAI